MYIKIVELYKLNSFTPKKNIFYKKKSVSILKNGHF